MVSVSICVHVPVVDLVGTPVRAVGEKGKEGKILLPQGAHSEGLRHAYSSNQVGSSAVKGQEGLWGNRKSW